MGSTRAPLLALLVLVPALDAGVAAAPGSMADWPDGCVDRVEDGVVVLATEAGEEVSLPVGPERSVAEGLCVRGGRPSPEVEARLRARAQALIDAVDSKESEWIISLTSDPR